MYINTHTCTHTHVHTHTYTYAYTYTYTYAFTHMHIHSAHTCAYAHVHTCSHTHTQSRVIWCHSVCSQSFSVSLSSPLGKLTIPYWLPFSLLLDTVRKQLKEGTDCFTVGRYPVCHDGEPKKVGALSSQFHQEEDKQWMLPVELPLSICVIQDPSQGMLPPTVSKSFYFN